MIPAETLAGRKVIANDAGATVGRITDTLLNADTGAVTGFLVRAGWLASARLLRRGDVVIFDDEAVFMSSVDRLVKTAGQPGLERDSIRTSDLKHKPVITVSGSTVGTIAEVYLDERGSKVAAYGIYERVAAGSVPRYSMLPHSEEIAVGSNAIIVSNPLWGVAGATSVGRRMR